MRYYLGIDQSKRSTGLVLYNERDEVVDFKLICSEEKDDVLLLLYQWKEVDAFLRKNIVDGVCLAGALIEGLSFGSVGSGKDFLAGLQWYMRARLRSEWGVFLGTVTVSGWRSKVLTKEEQRAAKSLGKDGLKVAVVDKLPEDVREAFADYVKIKGFKKASIYDLADAAMIAKHCKMLFTSK